MIKKEEYMRFLKKYQKVHCEPISLLKKNDLKKLAEKHGFNNPETKNSLTDLFPEGKAKQEKPKKAKVVPPSPTLEQIRKMIKEHDVSSDVLVAMSIPAHRKWTAERNRLGKMLDPFIKSKKVKS